MADTPKLAPVPGAALLLALAYLGFVSLGLPDGLLGAAWPALRLELGLPLEDAGQVLLLATVGTVISSVLSGRALARTSTGPVLAVSALLAATALLLYAGASSRSWLLLAAGLAGLGGGAVDAALNGFVARHYSVKHMNWLHGCWGVGATLGPAIVASVLGSGGSWRLAYVITFCVEGSLALAFIFTRRWWREPQLLTAAAPSGPGNDTDIGTGTGAVRAGALTRARAASVILFFCYCSLEAGAGLWVASLLVATRGTSLPAASAAVAVYWGLLTAGRFLLGAVAERIGPDRLLGWCTRVALAATVVLAIPAAPFPLAVLALAALGLALAPIYPLLMHDTPRRFGAEAARHLVGYQIAAGSAGIALVPWLLGMVARSTSLLLVPPLLAVLALVLVLLQMRRASGPKPSLG